MLLKPPKPIKLKHFLTLIVLLFKSVSMFLKEECPGLSNPYEGTVDHSEGLTVGSAALYNCDCGLESGQRERYCLPGGAWSGLEPICSSGRTEPRCEKTGILDFRPDPT